MRIKITALLCFVLCLTCFSAFSEESPNIQISGDYEYTVKEDNFIQITKYNGTAESLDIPSELDGMRVTSIGDNAFLACESLIEVSIPNSITDIESNPFGCTALQRIEVSPDHPTLTAIDGVLFSKAERRLVSYPPAFTSISYEIPQGTEIIGNSAFANCIKLKNIMIPDSVTTLGDESFYFCISLTDVNIPDSVTTIGNQAFRWCMSLTDITIPNNVTNIGDNPFTGCENLRMITVFPDHPTLATIDGVLICKEDRRLICYPYTFTSGSYVIPQDIEIIGNFAFGGCLNLRSVTIPESVTSIGNSAFASCGNLIGITIPSSVTSIGNYAFGYCSNLKNLIIPNGVTNIGNNAFSKCKSLEDLIIPSSVSTIGDWAFNWCSSLKNVTIPASVIYIGDGAFYYCSDDLTINVVPNSYAAKYCQENNHNFIYTESQS